MSLQLSILDAIQSQQLANTGLSLALESAEKKEKGWNRLCWQLFLLWLRRKKRYEEFRIEQFREYVYKYDLLTPPFSDRAFGFLSKRGVKEGWIAFSKVEKASNKKSHSTPVNVWYKK